MRILVVIGRVLDPRGIIVNRRAGRVFVNRQEYMLQPADRCALEAALRIRDADGAEVVALPRGPLPDDDVLRQALAAGADRAIYLKGKIGNLPYEDAVMTRLLVAAVERLGGADLLLTGATTLDTGQSQLGIRLAEAFGWPQVVSAWDVTVADGALRAVVHDGTGYVTVEASLPAVVTMAPGSLKLRYPESARLINVYKGVGEMATALETWAMDELVGADALQPLLEERGQDFPPERERGVRVGGSVDEMAQAAVDALRRQVRR